MNLHVDLTGSDSSAGATLDQINLKLDGLVTAFNRTTGAGDKAAGAIDKVASSSARAKVEGQAASSGLGSLGSVLQDISSHGRTAGIALDAIGLKTEGAVAKVSSLGQLFQGLGSAVPSLLAVGAAIGVIGGAFDELKSAVGMAAQWQQALTVLGVTVADQGANWARLSAQVQRYAELQEQTTRFSRTEVVQSLTELTSAGVKLGDAYTINRVAEDAAATRGLSLSSVDNALVEATHGRTQALVELGIGTRQTIHDGMKLGEILQVVEDRMHGAATADNYPNAVAKLQNAFDSLQEDIGLKLLPVLTKLVDFVTGMVQGWDAKFQAMTAATSRWASQHKALIAGVMAVFEYLVDSVRATMDSLLMYWRLGWDATLGVWEGVSDVLTGNWKQLRVDMTGIWSDMLNGVKTMFGAFGDDVIRIGEQIVDRLKRLFGGMGKAIVDELHGNFGKVSSDIRGAEGGLFASITGLKPISLKGDALSQLFSGAREPRNPEAPIPHGGVYDTMVGGPLSGGKHKAKTPFYFHEIADALKQIIPPARDVDVALKALPKSVAGYQAAIALLTPVVHQEAEQHAQIAQRLASAKETYEKARAAANAYGESLRGHINVSAQARQHLQDLEHAVSAAKTQYDHLNTALGSVNRALQHHQIELQNAEAGVKHFSNAWQNYFDLHHQQMEDDLATSRMTDAQKYQYYAQLVASIQATDQASLEQKEALYDQEVEAYKAMITDQERASQDAYKQMGDEAKTFSDSAATLFEGLFTKTDETLQRGRDKYHEWTNNFVKEWRDMIKKVEEALLKSTFYEVFFAGISGGKSQNFFDVFMQNMGMKPESQSAQNTAYRAGGIGAPPTSSTSPFNYLALAGVFSGGAQHGSITAPTSIAQTALGHFTGNAAEAGLAGASSGGIIGALIGTSAAVRLAAALPTDSLMSLLFGVGAPGATSDLSGGAGATGTTGAAASGASAGAGAAGSAATGGGIASGVESGALNVGESALGGALAKGGIGSITSLFGGSVGSIGGVALGTVGSTLLGAGAGYGIGDLLGSVVFPNQPYNQGSKIGGALGGAAGAALGSWALGASLGSFAGPVGTIAGAILGALVGGLFGNHDNPANMPDKYNTSVFGQAVANLAGYGTGSPNAKGTKGAYNANGTPFNENASLASIVQGITGGTNSSGIAGIEEYLAQYAIPGTTQPGPNTPSWLLGSAGNGSKNTLWQALVNNFGISATGSGQLNFGTDIGNEWITGASGTKFNANDPTNYGDLNQLLENFIEDYETGGAVSGSPSATTPIFESGTPGQGGSWFGSPFTAAYEVDTPGGSLTQSTLAGLPTLNVTPSSGVGTTTTTGSQNGAGETMNPMTPTTDIAYGKNGLVPVGGAGGSNAPVTQPKGPGTVGPVTIHAPITVQGNLTSENELLEKLKSGLIDTLTRLMVPSLSASPGIVI